MTEIYVQIVWLFVLSIPIACVAWTVTHEEVFREPREYCINRSKTGKSLLERKFFYLFTCEYCFSHYVTAFFILLTNYKLLINDWRGYIIAGFSLVWIANLYMSIFAFVRQDIKKEKAEIEVLEKKNLYENLQIIPIFKQKAMTLLASMPHITVDTDTIKIPTKGYAAFETNGILLPFDFDRREAGVDDVQIEILYCGVCHSDIHTVRSEWKSETYPIVPGHELAGVVIKVGENVTKFKVGDLAGVGCMVDSCGVCVSCKDGHEQYCDNHETTFTYGSPDKILGGITQGGYSKMIVVKEYFVIKIPASMDLKTAAPILCAGVTTFSPILAWEMKKGTLVGVAGIGGLGHMAIKLAVAKGADVVAFTTSPSKIGDILRFGAKEVIVVDDIEKLSRYENTLDFMISTIPAQYNIDAYFPMVKRNATFIQVGIGAKPLVLNMGAFTHSRVNFIGSLIGGIAETQAVIDFCALHNIAPEIELINMNDINEAHNNVVEKKARYRYVIDMATL